MNVSRLQKEQLVLGYHPVHEPFQLKGERKAETFKQLKNYKLLTEIEETLTETNLNEFYKKLENFSESTDFDSKPVSELTRLNTRIPWYINVDSIR